MSKREIENAVVESTRLGFDRGVFLSGWLHLKYRGGGQGFGGFVLGKKGGSNDTGAYAERWLTGVLDALGVTTWEDLPGTRCRVDHDWGKVYGVGHYMEDKWFYPAEEFAEIRGDQ